MLFSSQYRRIRVQTPWSGHCKEEQTIVRYQGKRVGSSGAILYGLRDVSPFPVEELLQKLTELLSAVNTGKDSL